MDCLISIIIPVYNVEKYLENCVRSIEHQSYQKIEIILVDDGATDNSGEMCDLLAKEDARIKVIHKINGGLSDARNIGIDNATGDYIMFVDSDDYIADRCVEVLLNNLLEHGASVSVCHMNRTLNLTEYTKEENYSIEVYDTTKAMEEMFYGKKYSTSACAKLYKTALFDEIRFPFGKFAEDLFTIYRVLNLCDKVVYCSYIGYYYYYRGEGSIVVAAFQDKHLEGIEALRNMIRDVDINEKLICAYASQVLSVVVDVLTKKPAWKQIKYTDVWKLMKENRRAVIKDHNAPKRLRGIGILSYLGPRLSIQIISLYYGVKWK